MLPYPKEEGQPRDRQILALRYTGSGDTWIY